MTLKAYSLFLISDVGLWNVHTNTEIIGTVERLEQTLTTLSAPIIRIISTIKTKLKIFFSSLLTCYRSHSIRYGMIVSRNSTDHIYRSKRNRSYCFIMMGHGQVTSLNFCLTRRYFVKSLSLWSASLRKENSFMANKQ